MESDKNNRFYDLRQFVNGEINTVYEYVMLGVVFINIVSLGVETSQNISAGFRQILFWIDQVCLWSFVFELGLKIVAYNKDFFGEYRFDGDGGKKKFHINKWNISDLIIVVVTFFSSLSFFSVFRVFRIFSWAKNIRSLRIITSFKIVNKFGQLRSIFNAILNRAIPALAGTFFFLAVFTYTYAIIGTNIFAKEFWNFFGTLGNSVLTLCQIMTLDSWVSEIARPVIQTYPFAWIYFISYTFIAALVFMNFITAIFVDAIKDERKSKKQDRYNTKSVKDLSAQISELTRQIADLKAHLEKSEDTP